MTTKKTVKNLPSDESIKKNKDDFAQMLQDLLSGTVKLPGQRETMGSKLNIIADILTPLKNEIESGKLKYRDIAKVIELKLKLKVSAQTLRTFCQDHLGFKKAERKKSIKKVVPITSDEVKEGNNSKSFDATHALSSSIDFK
ncbi:MAG: hypothetical protein K9L22_08370 [Methylococcaceae bacterium]|nr:hypothetical protein [Methylococcaceae bacterium]